ncbi:MAG: GDP/UDP-N,N'-diacetylbacillosamine 2-epimerase (hydrolyzing) [Verrucomicrobiales bacterium]
MEVIEKYATHPRIEVFRNVPEIPFVNLLRKASCLMGNSSMGLYEGPYLHLPVINAGARQTNRIHSENVFYTGNDRVEIARQLDLILHDPSTQQRVANCQQPFGDGRTAPRIAELLAELTIDKRLLTKDLTF